MSGQHEDIWQEITRLRERANQHADEIAQCQFNAEQIERLQRELEGFKMAEKATTVSLAVVQSDVENLKEIERGRLVKFSIIVGVISVAVQGLAWLLGRLNH